MKKTLTGLIVIVSLGTLVIAADLSGTWRFELLRNVADGTEPGPTVIITFKQSDQHLSGDCLTKEDGTKWTLTGEVDGNRVTWQCVSSNEGTATFKGTLTNSEMTGTWATAPMTAEGSFAGSKS